MKIMDLLGEDEDCQVETVINSKSKKTKQGRLSFQSLSADSPVVNKKRKMPASFDSRNAKQAKVNTKENSTKASEEIETKDVIIEKEVMVQEKESHTSESDDVKDCSKITATTEIHDSKNKKSTPGKGIVKTRKSEIKEKVNSLTKFLKKIDSKDKDIKTESNFKSEIEKFEDKNNVNNEIKVMLEERKNCKNQNTEENKKSDIENKLKKLNDTNRKIEGDENFDNKSKVATANDNNSDFEVKKKSKFNNEKLKDNISNNKNEELQNNISTSNEVENMEMDSDIHILSNDSYDDDNDDGDDDDDCDDDDDDDNSGKSDTDSKKTEHEDTDSKDDTRNTGVQALTPTRNMTLNCSVKIKKLTPKQIEKKLEVQKKRESREKKRLEREKKLQKERENRKKEKEEKRREREEKEKLLKEQKKKDKELKELKKQADIEQKQREKEAKEEDRRKREEAREEEKKRKEEEKLEAERKKLKAASNFVSFFVAKKPSETKPVEEESKIEGGNFMPFEIKADMRVAPQTRRNLTENEKMKLDKIIQNCNENENELYINEITSKQIATRKSGRTWPFEANDDIVIIDDEESSSVIQASNMAAEKRRAKLFLFEENRRPPYWGTWRKISKTINPRRPFAMDSNWFDYEIDSDDEWEEEEPGESLRGSDDEKEKDEENAEENEYDVDNDFMVPHGYLSEEEIGADEEDEDEMNPENQETKLKFLGEQFEAERNTKTKKLKPKVIGCVWLNKNNDYPDNTPPHAVQFLTARHIWVNAVPLILTAPADAENINDNENGTPSSKTNVASTIRKAKALEEAMPDLIRLLHGNTHGREFLAKEFLEFLGKKNEGEKSISKAKLLQKIRDVASWIACPEAGPMHEKFCWYVAEEYRIKYLPGEKLELPNLWTYSLTPKRKKIIVETTDKPDEKEKEKEKKNVPLITHFTKTLTAEEKQKQLVEKPLTPVSKLSEKSSTSGSAIKITPPLNKPPKRASLISVPRGEPLSKSPRVSLLDKFITKDNTDNSNNSKQLNKSKEDLDDDDCMRIDNSDEQIDIMSVSSKTEDEKSTSKSLFNVEPINYGNETMNNSDNSDLLVNVSKNSDVEILEV